MPAQHGDDLARGEARYRTIFDRMPVSFWELDSTRVRDLFDSLRGKGVTNFADYCSTHPELADEITDLAIVTDVNAETLKMMGATSRDQLLGPLSRLRGKVGDFMRAAEARFHGESTVSDLSRMETFDGRAIDVLWTMVFADEDGGDLNLIGAIDVTERQEAVAELARSEAKYRILFDHMPLPMVRTNAVELLSIFRRLKAEGVEDLGAYIHAHPGFMDHLLEIILVDEVNQPMVELLCAAGKSGVTGSVARFWKTNPDTVRRSLEARFRGDTAYVEETQVDTLDGRLVDIVYSVAYPPELNQLGIGITALIDNTERKRATEEIRQSEIKFRNLFNQTPIALWQLDSREARHMLDALYASGVTDYDAFVAAHPDFLPSLRNKMRITEINQAALTLLGATDRDKFSPIIFDHLFDSMDALRASAARRSGETSYSVESKIRTLDGQAVDVLSSIAFADPKDPNALHLVAAIDISDRKRAEEMLRKVQAEFAHAARVATLGELTASIAHEVNQPLAAIVTNGEASLRWLAREEPDIEEVRALAARMVADARRAADVIARIRAMATGKAPEHLPMCVNEAAEDAMRFLQHELELHRIASRLELAPDLPAVNADWTQLQQVLVNLSVNAMQAMIQHDTPDPLVTMRTSEAPEGGVLVEVDDNGPGIPADHAAHLFDSFFSTKEGGLGIGLSICRSIVEAHGGRIGCANLPVGARFSFTLPAAGQSELSRATV